MNKRLLTLAAITLAAFTATSALAAGTLDKIKESGSVSLGVRESSGLGYTLGNGKYVGFHTEMGERILADIQQQLGLDKLDITYQPITSQNRVPLIVNGTIDLECGSTTNNRARQRDVDFAITTYVETVRIAVRADSEIKDLRDLDGKTIVTTTGTTSVQILRRNKRAENLTFREIMGKDHSDSFLMLESGRADAFVMDGSILAANIAKSQTPENYKILDEVLALEPIACMLRKDDPEFKNAVDNSIKRQIADGSLLELYNKWFMQPIPPTGVNLNMPLSAATQEAWENPNNKPTEEYVAQ